MTTIRLCIIVFGLCRVNLFKTSDSSVFVEHEHLACSDLMTSGVGTLKRQVRAVLRRSCRSLLLGIEQCLHLRIGILVFRRRHCCLSVVSLSRLQC